MSERFKEIEESFVSRAAEKKEQRKRSAVRDIVLKIAAAAAVLLGAEGSPKAQQVFEFGPDVNNRTYYSQQYQEWVSPAKTSDPQLVVMPDKSRADMYFTALEPAQNNYVKRLRIEPVDPNDSSQGIRLVGLGEVTRAPGFNDPNNGANFLIPICRSDGRTTTIADAGLSNLDEECVAQYGADLCDYGSVIVDGTERWPDGPDLTDFPTAIHPSRLPDKARVTAQFNWYLPGPVGKNVWVVDIAEPNWYAAIWDEINTAADQGLNPYEAGILDLIESSDDMVLAPETSRLVLKTVDPGGGYDYLHYLLLRDPPSGASFDYLQRNPDGTYTIQIYENNYVYPVQHGARSMVDVSISSPNSNAMVLATYIGRTGNDLESDIGITKGFILEETPNGPGVYRDVPVIVEEDPNAVVNDDGDGDENEVDATPWLASADTDVAGPTGEGANGIPDIYEVTCDAAGYVGQAPQGTTASNGLAVCEGSGLDGYQDAYRENGQPTKYHVNGGEVVIENGAVAVQPGQKIRYMHTRLAGTEGEPSRQFTIPDEYAFKIKMNSTERLDGTDGTATLTYTDILNQPVTVTFNGPTNGWQEFPAATGIVFGAEGSDFEIEVSSEYVPLPCPPACDGGIDGSLPDAAVPDAQVPDASVPDAPLPDAPFPDAAVPDAPLPDAAFTDAALPDAPFADASLLPDAAFPDAAFPDGPLPDQMADSTIPTDALSSDAITADAMTINPDAGTPTDSLSADAQEKIISDPGCNCETPGSPQSPESPATSLTLLAGIAAMILRRVRRTASADKL